MQCTASLRAQDHEKRPCSSFYQLVAFSREAPFCCTAGEEREGSNMGSRDISSGYTPAALTPSL